MKKSARFFLLMAASSLAAMAIDRPETPAPAPAQAAPAPLPSVAAPNTQALPQQSAKAEPKLNQVWMGIVPATVPEALVAQLELSGNPGLLVNAVGPNSPARKAGIKTYDILLQINGTPLRSAQDIAKSIASSKPGDSVDVELIRGAKKQTVKVPLDRRPDNMPRVDGIMSDDSDQKLAGQLRNRLLPLVKSRKIQSAGQDITQKMQKLQNKFSNDLDGEMQKLQEKMETLMQQGIPQMDSHVSRLQALFNELENEEDAPPPLPSFTTSSSSAQISMSDGQGTLQISKIDGNTTVSVKDADGKILYNGPYNTDEQKAAVPQDVRARLDSVLMSQ